MTAMAVNPEGIMSACAKILKFAYQSDLGACGSKQAIRYRNLLIVQALADSIFET